MRIEAPVKYLGSIEKTIMVYYFFRFDDREPFEGRLGANISNAFFFLIRPCWNSQVIF